jgi:hypothetical protein
VVEASCKLTFSCDAELPPGVSGFSSPPIRGSACADDSGDGTFSDEGSGQICTYVRLGPPEVDLVCHDCALRLVRPSDPLLAVLRDAGSADASRE